MDKLKVDRVQTGVRLEKRLLKVLKGLAEYFEISMTELFEGILLHELDGKSAFAGKEEILEVIAGLRKVYGLALVALHRGGETFREGDGVRRMPFHAGDALVVHTTWEALARLTGNRDFVIVTTASAWV